MRARALSALPPTILLLAAAHLVVDGYANIYAPLLPLLIPRLGLSLAAAGTLAMLFQVAGSVSQLGFGWLADRWRPRVLLTAGPIVAVIALSAIGWSSSTAMLAAALVVGGLGSAAFHPPAAVAAHRLGGPRPGFAMSVYVTGGTLGFSLGPLFFAPMTEWLGLAWTPAMALPGLVVLAVFLRRAPAVAAVPEDARGGLRALRPYTRPLTLLYLIAVMRTLTGLCLTTYVPVLLTGRGMSLAEAGSAFALYLLASGAGGFLGGAVADRLGPRRVIVASLAAATPFLVVAPLLSGGWFIVVIAVGGFFLLATQPVTVTFGQMLAPVSAGTVASLMMGAAWGTAGLAVPLVGLLADRIGLEVALMWVSAVPLLGVLCAIRLPARVHAPAGPPAAA